MSPKPPPPPPPTPPNTLNLMTLNCCVHLPGARNVYNIALVSRGIALVLSAVTVGLFLWSRSEEAPSPVVRIVLHLLSIPFAIIVGQPIAMIMSFFIYAVKKDSFSEFKSEVRRRRV